MVEASERIGVHPSDAHLMQYSTILADPPWQWTNRTGKVAPEHGRLWRYPTMTEQDISSLEPPRSESVRHLYLWIPNALLPMGLRVMEAWGFEYKTNIVWLKVSKENMPDMRGVGFYFRNVTELCLFGVRDGLRTGDAGRRTPNFVSTRKREHSRKPEMIYEVIESCSPGPYLEMFARQRREGWDSWGNEVPDHMQKRMWVA